MSAVIKSCSCANDYQDKVYGAGRRVFNSCKAGVAVRCTVCGTEKTVSSSSAKVVDKQRKK
jgi:hypothetical protein